MKEHFNQAAVETVFQQYLSFPNAKIVKIRTWKYKPVSRVNQLQMVYGGNKVSLLRFACFVLAVVYAIVRCTFPENFLRDFWARLGKTYHGCRFKFLGHAQLHDSM